MGFATIIAGVYFVAVLIVCGYVVTDTVNRMSAVSYNSVLTATSIQFNRLGSSASITGLSVSPDGEEISVSLLNTGEVKIDNAEFSKIDVLLTYTDNGTGVTETHWCPYGSTQQDQTCYWSNNGNPSPAVVDPQDWNPSKTLSITIQLANPQQIAPDSAVYLKVVLPGGSSTEANCSFTATTSSTTTTG